jgi:hypothetical protein
MGFIFKVFWSLLVFFCFYGEVPALQLESRSTRRIKVKRAPKVLVNVHQAGSDIAIKTVGEELAINKIPFSMVGEWDTSDFTAAHRALLAQPSGLGRITVMTVAYLFDPVPDKVFDMTGTTNEQAIMKLRAFYNQPRVRAKLGDHVFFKGMHESDTPGTYVISFGS